MLLWDDVITYSMNLVMRCTAFLPAKRYATLSGTNTPRDFVEFPSQINEHWATHPQVFAGCARHYREQGAAMP
ncbi:M3 family metallopeptidase [Shigella flexneri]